MVGLGWACILLLALIWRLLGITGTQVWRDEAVTLVHTQASWWGLLTRLPWVEDSPPLGFLVFKLWSLSGGSELWFRVLPVLVGVGTVAVLMATAERVRAGSGWIVGLLAAFSHVPIHYSQEIRSYSLLLMATALCFWYAEKLGRDGGGRRTLALLVAAAVLAAHCHVAGLLVYPMVAVYVLVNVGGSVCRRFFWWPMPLAWLVGVLPVIWLARHWSPIHAADPSWWVPPMSWPRAANLTLTFLGFDRMRFHDLIASMPLGIWLEFGIERWLIVIPAILAIAGLAHPETRRKVLALGVAAGVYVALLAAAGVASAPGTAVRTLLPAWIPIIMLMGLGAVAASRPFGRTCLGLAGATLAVSYAGLWLGYISSGSDRRPPDRKPFLWLREQLNPDDLIVIHPAWMEEEVVYYLGDAVAADQFFTTANPVYVGKPPRHRLVPRVVAPDSEKRLRAAADSGVRADGEKVALFVVSPVAGGEESMSKALDALLPGRYTLAGSSDSECEIGVSIRRYVPAVNP